VNQNVRIVSVAYLVAGFYNESYRKICMLDSPTAMKLLQPGCRNVSETKEPSQSSRRQKCDMDQDPYSEPTRTGDTLPNLVATDTQLRDSYDAVF